MKSFFYFLTIPFMVLFLSTSCTKEGPEGPAGEDGVDGIDGLSGTTGCVQCHVENEDMKIKSYEWAESKHVNGGHMTGYYASRTGCTDCHSSQGFQHVISTGEWDMITPEKPLPANCYTCHKIHETYTAADWSLRKNSAVSLLANDLETDQGTSNTCVQCHQSRKAEPLIDLNGTTKVSITTFRFGPHHGPQGNMMAGTGNTGAYEIQGSMNYKDSKHVTDANSSCVSCHMASGEGSGGNIALGGHSNNVATGSWEDDSRVVNVNGCLKCHPETDNSSITALVKASRESNQVIINELRQKLFDMGYIDDHDYVIANGERASSDNPLEISPLHAAAVYNFKFITEDKSMLIHNPMYAKALVQNSLEALN